MSDDIRNLSKGIILNRESFLKQAIFSDELKDELQKKDHYLIINIPGEKFAKVSIFPIEVSSIMKLIVKLTAFSPELVKSISEILNDAKLDQNLVHTTGLCFSNAGCFYESYFICDDDSNEKFALVREKFKVLDNVNEIFLNEIELKRDLE